MVLLCVSYTLLTVIGDEKEAKRKLYRLPNVVLTIVTYTYSFHLFLWLAVNNLWIGDSGTYTYQPTPNETLNLTINKTSITTENEYSGWITIAISGTAKISNDLYHDAMNYYDATGNRIELFIPFLIDGEDNLDRVLHSVSPPLEHDHKYEFLYDATDQLHRIEFQITNDNQNDTASIFQIEIYDENILYRGR